MPPDDDRDVLERPMFTARSTPGHPGAGVVRPRRARAQATGATFRREAPTLARGQGERHRLLRPRCPPSAPAPRRRPRHPPFRRCSARRSTISLPSTACLSSSSSSSATDASLRCNPLVLARWLASPTVAVPVRSSVLVPPDRRVPCRARAARDGATDECPYPTPCPFGAVGSLHLAPGYGDTPCR